MSPDELREKLTIRRAEYLKKLSEHEQSFALVRENIRISEAHIDEIDFALEALDMAPPQAAPETRPKRRNKPRAAADTAHDDSHVNRSNAREASSMSAPNSDGAGDPLEMPGFLKRDRQAAE